MVEPPDRNWSNVIDCRSINRLMTRQYQPLFVLAISAATRTAYEQLRLRRRSGVSCDRNRCGGYQNSMPNNVCSKYRIISDCDGKTHCPHDPQRLQNVMPYRNIWNMAQRTYFSIKYKIPCGYDNFSHKAIPIDHHFAAEQTTDPQLNPTADPGVLQRLGCPKGRQLPASPSMDAEFVDAPRPEKARSVTSISVHITTCGGVATTSDNSARDGCAGPGTSFATPLMC